MLPVVYTGVGSQRTVTTLGSLVNYSEGLEASLALYDLNISKQNLSII